MIIDNIIKWSIFIIILFCIIQHVRTYYLVVRFLSTFIATRIFYREYHKEILNKETWEPKRKLYLCWNGRYLVIAYLSSDAKKADKAFLALIDRTEKAYEKLSYNEQQNYIKEYKKILLLRKVIES